MKAGEPVRISVVVPVHNMAGYLKACLDSVLNQTMDDFEVVCVDDGSTDASAEILDAYAAKDARIRVMHGPCRGVSAARNAALRAAAGRYVAFLDADDLYPDDGVFADLLAAAERSGARICGGSMGELLPTGSVRTDFSGAAAGFVFREEGDVDFAGYAFDYGFTRFLYEREFLLSNGIDFPPYARFQDPPFLVRALAAARRFHAIPRCVYLARVELRDIDWRGDGAKRARGLLLGLADTAAEARRLGLRRLEEVLLFQAMEQHADVLLDRTLLRSCPEELRALCAALGVEDLRALWRLPYPGRTPLPCRRMKRWVKRHCRGAFRVLRLFADCVRFGGSYAWGRYRGRRP